MRTWLLLFLSLGSAYAAPQFFFVLPEHLAFSSKNGGPASAQQTLVPIVFPINGGNRGKSLAIGMPALPESFFSQLRLGAVSAIAPIEENIETGGGEHVEAVVSQVQETAPIIVETNEGDVVQSSGSLSLDQTDVEAQVQEAAALLVPSQDQIAVEEVAVEHLDSPTDQAVELKTEVIAEVQPVVEVAEIVQEVAEVQPDVEVAEIVQEVAEVQPDVEVAEVQPDLEVVQEVAEVQPDLEVVQEVAEVQPDVEIQIQEVAEVQKDTEVQVQDVAEIQVDTEAEIQEVAEVQADGEAQFQSEVENAAPMTISQDQIEVVEVVADAAVEQVDSPTHQTVDLKAEAVAEVQSNIEAQVQEVAEVQADVEAQVQETAEVQLVVETQVPEVTDIQSDSAALAQDEIAVIEVEPELVVEQVDSLADQSVAADAELTTELPTETEQQIMADTPVDTADEQLMVVPEADAVLVQEEIVAEPNDAQAPIAEDSLQSGIEIEPLLPVDEPSKKEADNEEATIADENLGKQLIASIPSPSVEQKQIRTSNINTLEKDNSGINKKVDVDQQQLDKRVPFDEMEVSIFVLKETEQVTEAPQEPETESPFLSLDEQILMEEPEMLAELEQIFSENQPEILSTDIREEAITESPLEIQETEQKEMVIPSTDAPETKFMEEKIMVKNEQLPTVSLSKSLIQEPSIIAQETIFDQTAPAQETTIEEALIEQEPLIEDAVVTEQPTLDELTVETELLKENVAAQEPLLEEVVISQEPVFAVETPISEVIHAEEPLIEEVILEEIPSEQVVVEEEPIVEEIEIVAVQEPSIFETVAQEPLLEETIIQEPLHQETIPVQEPRLELIDEEERTLIEAVDKQEPVVLDTVALEPILVESIVEQEPAIVQTVLEPEPVLIETIVDQEPVLIENIPDLEPVLVEMFAEQGPLIVPQEPAREEAIIEPEPTLVEVILEPEPIVVEAVAMEEPSITETLAVPEPVHVEEIVLQEPTPVEAIVEIPVESVIGETVVAQEPTLVETSAVQEPVVIETIVAQEPVVAETVAAQEPVVIETIIEKETILEEPIVGQEAPQDSLLLKKGPKTPQEEIETAILLANQPKIEEIPITENLIRGKSLANNLGPLCSPVQGGNQLFRSPRRVLHNGVMVDPRCLVQPQFRHFIYANDAPDVVSAKVAFFNHQAALSRIFPLK